MSSSNYKCIKLAHHTDATRLIVGDVYELDVGRTTFKFISARGVKCHWDNMHLVQFEKLPPSRKLKGYVFRSHVNCIEGRYFDDYKCGLVTTLEAAHVYTVEEALSIAARCAGWGDKEQGKWRAVYE